MRTDQARAESSAAAMERALSAMGSWSPLSSIQSSPRATPTFELPRINDQSPSSSALSTPRATPVNESPSTSVRVSKIRKPQPKGAGNNSLTDIVTLESGLLERIKVCPSCQSCRDSSLLICTG